MIKKLMFAEMLILCIVSSSLFYVHADSVYDEDHMLVYEVQKKLNQMGYACGEEDGYYGEKTKKALQKYYDDMGESSTPEIRYKLLCQLGIEINIDKVFDDMPTLWDASYIMEEYAGYNIDTTYDTIKAGNNADIISTFQKDKGLDVTGLFNTETLNKLEELYFVGNEESVLTVPAFIKRYNNAILLLASRDFPKFWEEGSLNDKGSELMTGVLINRIDPKYTFAEPLTPDKTGGTIALILDKETQLVAGFSFSVDNIDKINEVTFSQEAALLYALGESTIECSWLEIGMAFKTLNEDGKYEAGDITIVSELTGTRYNVTMSKSEIVYGNTVVAKVLQMMDKNGDEKTQNEGPLTDNEKITGDELILESVAKAYWELYPSLIEPDSFRVAWVKNYEDEEIIIAYLGRNQRGEYHDIYIESYNVKDGTLKSLGPESQLPYKYREGEDIDWDKVVEYSKSAKTDVGVLPDCIVTREEAEALLKNTSGNE